MPCLLFLYKKYVTSESHKADDPVIAISEIPEAITDADVLYGEGFHTIVITMVAINIIAIRIHNENLDRFFVHMSPPLILLMLVIIK